MTPNTPFNILLKYIEKTIIKYININILLTIGILSNIFLTSNKTYFNLSINLNPLNISILAYSSGQK